MSVFMKTCTHLVPVYEYEYTPCTVYTVQLHHVYPLGGVGDQEPGREREDVGHQPQGGGGS